MENLSNALDSFTTRLKTLTPEERAARDESVRKHQAELLDLERRNRLRQLMDALGPRYHPQRVTLDNFQVYHPLQQQAIDQIRAAMATWPDAIKEGRGLVLIGPPGTGKDHLLAAAAYHAANQHACNCSWLSGLEFAGRLRDLIGSKRETEGSLLEQYLFGDVLILSDPLPPSGELTSYVQAAIMRLIDARYRALRSTWLSVNAENAEDAAARLGAPTFDRIREGATVIQCYWPSFRQRKKA